VYADIGSDTFKDSTFKGIDTAKFDIVLLGIETTSCFAYFLFS